MYEFTDIILDYLNKRFIKRFKVLKTVLKSDEINRMKEAVDEVYEDNYKDVRSKYREIGRYYYREAGGKDEEDIIDYLWIDKFLQRYDPVTKYVFQNEVDRKRARTFEMMVASDNPKDMDTSLRLWAGQVKQWAEEVTDTATIEGYKSIGIKRVKWNTEKDDRVCAECHARDGVIFNIDNIPDKPHIGCRCWLTPVRENGESNGKQDNN
jgi:hypothetical protein